jgi:hypothetical protein
MKLLGVLFGTGLAVGAGAAYLQLPFIVAVFIYLISLVGVFSLVNS